MQLYFPREQEIPSVEMLQKRLDSLREMPIVEDDTNLMEENKLNDQSPMETEETDDALKVTSQEDSKDSTQQGVPEKGVSEKDSHSVDLDRGDDQHPNSDTSPSHDDQNVDVPFTKEDNVPSSGDGEIPEDEEKVDSRRDQEDDALSLEKSQKDDAPSPETAQSDDLQPSKSPSNIPSLPNDQTSLQKEDDGTPPPIQTKHDDTPPPLASPRDSEDTQDVQQSSAMDTSSPDQSVKPQKDTSEGEDQLPILQRSVTGPASM